MGTLGVELGGAAGSDAGVIGLLGVTGSTGGSVDGGGRTGGLLSVRMGSTETLGGGKEPVGVPTPGWYPGSSMFGGGISRLAGRTPSPLAITGLVKRGLEFD
jgi:hypothetical protein